MPTNLHVRLWELVAKISANILSFRNSFTISTQRQKVNKHPNFNNNFDIRHQLEHFEYDMNRTLVDFLVSNVFGAGTERHQEFIQDLVQGTPPDIFMTPSGIV